MTSPVPGYNVTTPYGRRGPYWSCDRDASGNGIHTGADFAAPTGTRVVAARPGKVVYSSHGSAFGSHQIDVVCGDGTRDFYAHMPTRSVGNGAHVDAGQQIGTVGEEGNVTGPHLHFERHATEYGGWSCSVVRDPAPSINYAAEDTGDDDMPEYAHAKRTKDTTLRDGEWYPIEWEASGDVFDGPGIKIDGCRYSATLCVDVSDRNGATVQTSFVEFADGGAEETSPTASHGALDHCVDTRNGSVSKDRRLRARVRVTGHDATLSRASIALLIFRP
jgi:murein DD-endopeptidase MepM/ murein hydrolase activator NlpD